MVIKMSSPPNSLREQLGATKNKPLFEITVRRDPYFTAGGSEPCGSKCPTGGHANSQQGHGQGPVQGAQQTHFIVSLPVYLEKRAAEFGRRVWGAPGEREGGRGEGLGLC